MNSTYLQQHWLLFSLLLVWTVFWKGWALWRAAHKEDKAWFIVLLVLNTAGLLEIFYLFVFSKRQHHAQPKLEE